MYESPSSAPVLSGLGWVGAAARAAPGVLTGVERRVDGLEEIRPGKGVDGPDGVAECVGMGDGALESFVEAGMLLCARCAGWVVVVDIHPEFALVGLGCEKEKVSDSSMIRVSVKRV
jgi:hypothetical protein